MKSLVVITGASSGLGSAMAKRFSEAGHPLLLLARRLEKIEALELPNSLCRRVDITDAGSFKKAIDEAEELYGPADCLINNAGQMLLGQVDSQDRTEWKRMFDLNVLALLDGMQIVLDGMKGRNTGTIINISSLAGVKTFQNHAAYSGTKYAVSGITETVREEVAPFGVRVVSVCPGAVETELLGHTTDKSIIDGYLQWKDEMGGVLDPDDVARTVLFIYQQPQYMNIREVKLAATRQGA